ncbi:centromere protein R isoform X2 [Lissotriton helveticus]
MPVKRSLKLDDAAKSSNHPTPKKQKPMLNKIFSPTTGTCQLSPYMSPNRAKEKTRELPSAEKDTTSHPLEKGHPSREQTPRVVLDEFMVLHSRAEKSLASFIKMRKNLTSLQQIQPCHRLRPRSSTLRLLRSSPPRLPLPVLPDPSPGVLFDLLPWIPLMQDLCSWTLALSLILLIYPLFSDPL